MGLSSPTPQAYRARRLVAVAAADETVSVVRDLVRPLRPGRHSVTKGRQAGFDEAGRIADGTGAGCQCTSEAGRVCLGVIIRRHVSADIRRTRKSPANTPRRVFKTLRVCNVSECWLTRSLNCPAACRACKKKGARH